MNLRALAALLLLTGLGAAPVTAQRSAPPWRANYFPFIDGQPNDFPAFAFRYQLARQAGYFDRYLAAGDLTAEAGISLHGSRFVEATFHAPGLWDGWRLHLRAGALREARLGYFGLGNDTQFDPALVTTGSEHYYRVIRRRYLGTAEVTRRLTGRFAVAAAGGVEDTHFGAVDGTSLFGTTVGSRIQETNVTGRVSLLYDSRDNEYNTHRGLLLEAGAMAGSSGDGYTRLYTNLRGYLEVREGTVVATRLLAVGTEGTPSLNSRFELPMWERMIYGFGGKFTNRGLDDGRFAGEHYLLGNLEVRHDLLNLGDLGGVTLLGFVDAGRVFEGEPFRWTTDALKVGGGGGVAIRILRGTIFTFNFAGGPEGFNFSTGGGWMF